MARRSRYLHYDEQMTALMKRGNLSQIPANWEQKLLEEGKWQDDQDICTMTNK